MTAIARACAALALSLSLLVGPAAAGDRQLGVDPAPASLDVVATTWSSPAAFKLPGQAMNTSFMGGGLQLWVCFAHVTIKDPAQAQLKTRVLFNGAAGTLAQTTTNADGSTTRLYQVISPPLPAGSAICQTQLQVAKTSANIALRAAPAPPEEDQLVLSVPTPVN